MRVYAVSLSVVIATFVLVPTTTSAQPTQPMRPAQPSQPAPQRPIPQQTIDNLNTAIEGEANASHRYTLFARRADEEGHAQVAKLFRAAALAESIHRANHERVLRNHGIEPKEPVLEDVKVGTTRENLEVPVKGEAEEREETYPAFVRQARRDDVPGAVRSFTFALNTEAEHAKLFQDALTNFGRNPPTDYFVGKVSGDTVTKVPDPQREPYVKVQ